MEAGGNRIERDTLVKWMVVGHYIVVPVLLILLGLWGSRSVWLGVVGFVLFAVFTEVWFKTCLLYELERYVRQWDGFVERRGSGRGCDWSFNEIIREHKEKVSRRPWFFMRFVGLGVSFLLVTLLLGRWRGFL